MSSFSEQEKYSFEDFLKRVWVLSMSLWREVEELCRVERSCLRVVRREVYESLCGF